MEQIVRGPILNPQEDGSVRFYPDGALMSDKGGRIEFAGDWPELHRKLGGRGVPMRQSEGIVTPAFLDAHIHIPQNPIRGKFTDGISGQPPEGRLLAGLNRNVFPEEARDADPAYAATVVENFLRDTLSQGVVGGAAYMTVHAAAARAALSMLPESWMVGLVLMNMNCPPYLRTNEASLEMDFQRLAGEFGPRVIVTDRFAVSVDTQLRKRGVEMARNLKLRMQTHLNEQRAEKSLIEETLYPTYDSYTDVYAEDGLLDHRAIMAHCIHMKEDEFRVLRDTGSFIAHCPTSNSLLGSGIMPLDEVVYWKIPYAICTDVGASPTTSLLQEMEHFLLVHNGRNHSATPSSALYGITLGAAKVLGMEKELGSFRPGKRMTFLEIQPSGNVLNNDSADDVILSELLSTNTQKIEERTQTNACGYILTQLSRNGLKEEADIARLREEVEASMKRVEHKVMRVTVNGMERWKRKELASAK